MKKILVAPLDWGLGHATRCIPVIRELLAQKCDVHLAGNGASLALLKKEFPVLPAYSLPAYAPEYPRDGSMAWKMLRQLPKFLRTIKQEHRDVEELVTLHAIDGIISDNRYGCWSSRVPSVFITHQSNILMPKRFGWLSGFVRRVNMSKMKKFTLCWIPDVPNRSLAGKLMTFGELPKDFKYEFIGPLSRFSPRLQDRTRYDLAAIFSGPEPQRTMLENIVVPQLEKSTLRYFVVRGVFRESESGADGHSADFMTSSELQQVIESSEIILARSGYSTVMDLAALGKRAIFIPTPGQTEQEYLANRLCDMGIAFYMQQKNFDLNIAIENSKRFTGFRNDRSNDGLVKKAIQNFLALNNSQ
jgi:uncharacterized protein (TIGR00661 family)